MSSTYTRSQASTFSEARAREVMSQVLGDFMCAASAGFIAHETIRKWHEDIEYAVLNEAVASFELQLTKPSGARAALRYMVSDDGTILGSAKAGGIDFFSLPSGTRASVCLSYREGAKNLEKVKTYLHEQGWRSNGSLVEGPGLRDRAFSKDGFGIARDKVGDWT